MHFLRLPVCHVYRVANCIVGSVHTAHVRFTSHFGKTPTAKKTQPPQLFFHNSNPVNNISRRQKKFHRTLQRYLTRFTPNFQCSRKSLNLRTGLRVDEKHYIVPSTGVHFVQKLRVPAFLLPPPLRLEIERLLQCIR